MPRKRKSTGPFLKTNGGLSFETFTYSAKNRSQLSQVEATSLERKARVLGLISENPERLFSDPALRGELHIRVPEQERVALLRAQLRTILANGLANPRRLRREERFFPSEKRREILFGKLDTLSEHQLVILLLRSRRGKKRDVSKHLEEFLLKMSPELGVQQRELL